MDATQGLRLIGAAALIALFGCGGGDDDDDAAGGIAIDDLPAKLAERACAEVESCFDARSLEQLFGEDGCAERFAAQFEDGDFAHLKDAVEDGSVAYDEKQAQKCLDAIEGLGCDFGTTRLLGIGACDSTFEGKQKLGEPCNIDAECDGKTFCKHGAACPGECSALLGPSERCERDDACEDGLSCDDSDTCAAPVAEGKACGGDVAAECAPGLACIGADDDSAGTCRALDAVFAGKLGDTCDFDSGMLCEGELSCVVDSITAGKPTLVCAERSASGAPCKFGAPAPCPSGEFCTADIAKGETEGTCTELPGAGDACVALTGAPACAPGLLCDGDKRCHPINRLGQPCVSDDGCASKHCVSGRCERPETCDL
jgi:hypothetical protein